MQYHPPSGSTDPNAPYVGKNVAAGIIGSKIPPGMPEFTQREIVNAISLSGQTPTDTDPNQLTRAIRGGQLDFASDTGTANALVATLGLAHNAMKAGLPFKVLKGNATNTSTTPTLTVTGPGGANAISGVITKCDGTPLAAGDLPAGGMLIVISDGANWRLLALLTRSDVLALIAANAPVYNPSAVLYVRADANGTKPTGLTNTQADAFPTIAAAVSYGTRAYYFPGGSLTIQLGISGTYAAPPTINLGAGTLVIQGDINNQAQYNISGAGPSTGGTGVIAVNACSVSLIGVRIINTAGTNNSVAVTGGGNLNLQNVSFANSQPTTYANMYAEANGVINLQSGCILESGTASNGPAIALSSGATLTMRGSCQNGLSGSTSWSTFCSVSNSAHFILAPGGYSFTGYAASGTRYSATFNGTVSVNGAGANFFPGSTAGSTASGGQYA